VIQPPAASPYLSPVVVSITQAQACYMAAVVAAIEEVVALPAYRSAVLAWAPQLAQVDPGTPGVLLGYDFHLGPEGPRLIEINTNAGGLMLLADAPGEAVRAMFLEEWRRAGHAGPLGAVAIVDDQPHEQFLYPEFLRLQALLNHHGIETFIAAPEELQYTQGQLQLADRPLAMVYNRLTDFTLEQPSHAALRAAYQARAVLVTPHPYAHALYADKRNLTLLGDADWLLQHGASTATAALLAEAIPTTRRVTPQHATTLWEGRRHWFFKPERGYGGKGAYRGDKLTQRVWQAICTGGYVAQRLVPPSQVPGPAGELKLDLRHYVYAGRLLHLAARLYRGQTTNLRTPGGGLASVVVTPTPSGTLACA